MGGVETRWIDEFHWLKKHNFNIFLFVDENHFNSDFVDIFSEAKIIPFSAQKLSVMANFIALVEEIIDRIEHFNISHVSIHMMNFFGLAALFAAQLTQRPVIVTTHGVTEVYQRPVNRLLLQHLTKKSIGLQVYVSKLSENLSYKKDNATIRIPNLINLEQYRTDKSNTTDNGSWLMVSRISREKYPSITTAIALAEHCNAQCLDIVGGGDTTALRKWLEEKNYTVRVNFLGQSTVVHQLIPQYHLVIGMGRVALEGLACKKPTCIIAPDGALKGLVTPDRFARLMDYNFTGNTLKTITEDEFLQQRREFSKHDSIELHFLLEKSLSTEKWSEYITFYQNVEFVEDEALVALFHKMSFFSKNMSAPFVKDKLFLHLLQETIVEYNMHDTQRLWDFYSTSGGLRKKYPNPYAIQKDSALSAYVQKIVKKYKDIRRVRAEKARSQ